MPEIIGKTWFNTPHPITPEEMNGRIVLIDFFTYSCVNCVRTIPHLKEWWRRYKGFPFFIIGIHTPEFEFEKDPVKVKKALDDLEIEWPVVLDNDYVNWHNFANHYWPAKYLFDSEGRLVYDHYGEGGYTETEENIQKLLKATGEQNLPPIKESEQGEGRVCTIPSPELYLGHVRGSLANPEGYHIDHLGNYLRPKEIPRDMVALSGEFNAESEYVESFANNSTLYVNFHGTEVNLVLEPAFDELAVIEIKIDGKPVSDSIAGKDLDKGDVIISESRMYNLIKSDKPISGILSIQAKQSNFKAYAFTFSGCAD